MLLTFLGTGPAGAIPRQGHRDALCRAARRGGKSRRTRSAALLETGGTTILIDSGPDIEEQLERAHPERIDAVLLTHGHSDAAGGLRDLNRWLGRHFGNVRVAVVTDHTTRRRLARKFGALPRLEFVGVRSFRPMAAGAARIIPFPVRHSMTPGFATFGFSFGKSLAYASDAASIPSRSKRLIAGTDTLILDAAAYFGTFIASHLSADRAIALGAELRVRRLILTQVGHTYPPHEKAEREIRRFLEKMKTDSPEEVRIAFDGMRVAPQSL